MSTRIKALDGVRGLAVALVTLSHAGWPVLKLGAIAGVTLFFVLSGFLITGLLLDEHAEIGTVRLRAFYRRRALRLLPALVLLLVAYLPLALLVGIRPAEAAASALVGLLYVANIASIFDWPLAGLGNLWSLALEEQFYVVWPVLLILVLRVGQRRLLLGVAIALASASLAARFVLHDWTTTAGYRAAYYLPHATVWALLLGAALAVAVRLWPQVKAPQGTAGLALVGLLLVSGPLGLLNGLHSGQNFGTRLVAGPLAALCGVLLLWAATTNRPPRLLTEPLALYLGAISYGLYLWHGTLQHLSGKLIATNDYTHILLGTGLIPVAVLVAHLSYRHVETPFLRLKDRSSAHSLEKPRSSALTLAGEGAARP